MTRASSKRKATKETASGDAPQRTESGSQTSSSSASQPFPDTFPMTSLIQNPPERTPTKISQRSFEQLRFQFGIRAEDALLPSNTQTADMPPPGFISVNRLMCSYGAIPPFNPFLENILRQLSIAPSQLHPNGYAILLGLCVLFMGAIRRLPTFEEINFLCIFGKGRTHPSIINVKGARSRRLILDLRDSAHGYLNQFFYVNCPVGFYSIWREGGKTHVYLNLP